MDNEEVENFGEDELQEESVSDQFYNDTIEADQAAKEIQSIKITDEDVEKYKIGGVVLPKKTGRPKKDVPTPKEVVKMSDEEVEAVSDDDVLSLYKEFNSFLEDKTKIKQDVGIKETIPTGIDLLDAIMGGGFAIGSMGMIVGQPGGGKSMLAIQVMASAQQKFKGNVLVSYLDSEEATTQVRMANLGVRFPKILPYVDITIEKVFKFLEGLCLYKEMKNLIEQPSVVVWDSIANTLSQKEREVEDINSAIGYKARLLSVLIPKYVAKISAYNICLITINQLRDSIQIGPMASPKDLNFMRQGKTIPGGNTLKFNAFHILDTKVKSTLDPAKFGFDGIACEIKAVKNKLFPPNIPVQIIGNFTTGFSNFWTNYVFLVDTKRLTAGSWSYLNSFPQKKFRTKEAYDIYKSDNEFKGFFDSAVKEALDSEIIQKNSVEI
jgi:RecA/RadA recombinase